MASICQREPSAASQPDLRMLSAKASRVKPLHVLTLTPFYPIAGDDAAGCFVAEPLRYLADFGIRNSVIATRPFYRGGRVAANSSVYSATWVRYASPPGMAGLAFCGRSLYLRIRAAVQRLHAAEPLSLIHAHAALPCGHAAALIAHNLGIPFVVTVHGRDVFSSRGGGFAGKSCKQISQEVYRAAARVICISGKVQEDLLSGMYCHASVVHNGVDTEMFSPAISRKTNPVVLSVGNLIATKGHETLLRAVAVLSIRHPLLGCQIIGIGPERHRLVRLARELGLADRVEFLGRQSRAFVAKAMKGCSVFALPSTYEGLGCVYLEAMATGKPAVGCTGQGIAEVIKCEENGWLVEPDDAEGLAKVLHQLLDDPVLINRLGTNARQGVLESFTLQHQAERLTQIYEECVQ
jgi:glycosyltransferase involved in cell wall biosynthesis